MRLILLCLVLLGCSTTPIKEEKPFAYPAREYTCSLKELELKFYEEMAIRGVFIPTPVKAVIVPKLTICDKDKDAIGCAYYGGKIELLRRFWNAYDCGWREALVFHEHAHSELKLGHQKRTLLDPYIEYGYKCLLDDRKACLDQLAERYKAVLFFSYDAKRIQLQTPRLR